jgi:hypothetical protein
MGTHSKILALSFVILMAIASSCSKYEDGPKFSLLSKKKRISRVWKVEYSINLATQVEHSADFADWLLDFGSDGSYTYTTIYKQLKTTTNGNWELIGDTQLKLNYSTASGEQIVFYTILRLTKKELWLKNEFEEIHYYND